MSRLGYAVAAGIIIVVFLYVLVLRKSGAKPAINIVLALIAGSGVSVIIVLVKGRAGS